MPHERIRAVAGKEVIKGYDCGIQIKGYNDIEMDDVIEAYHEVAIKKKLK